MAGGVPPFDLLRAAGVSFDPRLRPAVEAPTERGTGVLPALIAAFVAFRHRDNIRRIRAGAESRVGGNSASVRSCTSPDFCGNSQVSTIAFLSFFPRVSAIPFSSDFGTFSASVRTCIFIACLEHTVKSDRGHFQCFNAGSVQFQCRVGIVSVQF